MSRFRNTSHWVLGNPTQSTPKSSHQLVALQLSAHLCQGSCSFRLFIESSEQLPRDNASVGKARLHPWWMTHDRGSGCSPLYPLILTVLSWDYIGGYSHPYDRLTVTIRGNIPNRGKRLGNTSRLSARPSVQRATFLRKRFA